MAINDDVVAIDDSLNHFAKVCKKIGHIEEQLNNYMSQDSDRNFEMISSKVRRRADLENKKAEAENEIYKRFDHYYS